MILPHKRGSLPSSQIADFDALSCLVVPCVDFACANGLDVWGRERR